MKATIVITSYNYGSFIERCIRSCLDQKYMDSLFEVIIVDDASTDDTIIRVKPYLKKYKNLFLIQNDCNYGVAYSSNVGIKNSSGRFIVRVDADDYVSVDFLYMLTRTMKDHPKAFGVSCDYIKVDRHDQYIERFSAKEDPISCGIVYPKDRLSEAGLYNDDFRHCEEMELKARMGEKYKIVNLPVACYFYNIHGDNKTNDKVGIYEAKNEIKKRHN